MEKKFREIKKIVEKELCRDKNTCPAHKMDHVLRVYNLCLHLAKGEDVGWEVLKAAALLHDIGRAKEAKAQMEKSDHAVISAKMAEPILKRLGFSNEKINKIKHCILVHRYRKGRQPKTMEAKILFDADKLDSLGAIGVARSFVWAGRYNAHIHRPFYAGYIKKNLGGKKNGIIKDRSQHSPQIEFETKLKFLVDKLYTGKAKKIGRERIRYLKNFMSRLEKEIKGNL